MQKVSLIFFTLFYTWASIGISINIHYCLGQLESVKVFADLRQCCCGDLEAITKCCDDESISIQLDDGQQASSSLEINFPIFSHVIEVQPYQDPFIADSDESIHADWLANPPPLLQPKWLMNCSLTFYG